MATRATRSPRTRTRIPFAYSPEKEKLLVPLIDKFNGEGPQGRRQRGRIVGQSSRPARRSRRSPAAGSEPRPGRRPRRSGAGCSTSTRPALRADARTPRSSGRRWSSRCGSRSPGAGLAEEADRLRRDPPARANPAAARALGHARVRRLQARAHESRTFRPPASSAVVAEYYAATGKKEGLTEADVTALRGPPRPCAGSSARSCTTATPRCSSPTSCAEHGPGYASAVAMEEVTLLDFNRRRGSQPKLVAIYPTEGTFYSDNPFIVLDAPWVRRHGAPRGAGVPEFLADEVTPELAPKSGFRPADLEAKPVAPIDARATASTPAADPRPRPARAARAGPHPDGTWREDRKPANVLLVVDTSGSMATEPPGEGEAGAATSSSARCRRATASGLTTFSDRIQPVVTVRGPFSANAGAAALDGQRT